MDFFGCVNTVGVTPCKAPREAALLEQEGFAQLIGFKYRKCPKLLRLQKGGPGWGGDTGAIPTPGSGAPSGKGSSGNPNTAIPKVTVPPSGSQRSQCPTRAGAGIVKRIEVCVKLPVPQMCFVFPKLHHFLFQRFFGSFAPRSVVIIGIIP